MPTSYVGTFQDVSVTRSLVASRFRFSGPSQFLEHTTNLRCCQLSQTV